jgi:hypothetical protein
MSATATVNLTATAYTLVRSGAATVRVGFRSIGRVRFAVAPSLPAPTATAYEVVDSVTGPQIFAFPSGQGLYAMIDGGATAMTVAVTGHSAA